jgi:hypothetical protein
LRLVTQITEVYANDGALLFYVMFRSIKFAAVMMVLVILSAPLLAVGSCFSGASAATMHCPAGCSMMASADAAAMHLSAQQHSGAPCCNVSNTKPSPSAVPQAPVTGVSIAPQAVSTTPGLAPSPFRVRRQQTQPVRLPESPQSLLCVFLI